ncbi:glycoside hydrolase family 78 protein [Flammeovirga pacifica]|uniref:alpha-L-rhamnosidase n=1 Tax=Flammeovirga pacifica TaxID=915059 RepID=A0A1S1YUV8_FLAPC|nr:glycoside hydrolase family 78 protein [Flammeovirga pacifica]OHX64806.1 alpha-L-rhamnosidase [Flammeovirga pacifica]
MKWIYFFKCLLVVTLISLGSSAKNIEVSSLLTEYRSNPVGIDVQQPRLTWKLISKDYQVKQTAYEIRVGSSIANLKNNKDLYWSTGKVVSDQSVNIIYDGKELVSSERVYWQVRVWDNQNKSSHWSTPSYFEMGLMEVSKWEANWITKSEEKSTASLPSQYYRNDFKVKKEIKSARVYVSSLGLYQLYLNGEKVGDQLFTPGFTSYNNRIQYQVYDITNQLKSNNAIGAIVGDGWYRGNLGWEGDKGIYGDQLGLIAQIEINYKDGTKEVLGTDKNWKTSYGPITKSDIYNGEKYDARKEEEGWNTFGFNDQKWASVAVLDHSKNILVASNSLPVKAIQEIKPIKKFTTPKGEKVYDLGQNIVGWARIKVNGEKGTSVTLKFAEALDKEGNFFTKNLRSAEATDIYILKGEGEEVFEPHFTFHGFRYISIEGQIEELSTEEVTGVVIHSEMQSTGSFSCSDSLINQLQSNIRWSQKDNFLDIPTDCPQRDERVGWTGDTQVFSMTGAYNFNVAPFYTKWLKDLALDQQPDGEVPNIIPDMWNNKLGGSTAWGDAAVIVPWTVYKVYGDKRILEEQYNSMEKWVLYMKKRAGDDYLWNETRKHHWGDWLAFQSNNPSYAGAVTEKDLIATAYYHYSTSILSKVAGILGHKEAQKNYQQLAEKVKEAFINEYITPNGRLVSHTQTAYALAISFDLVPEHLKQAVAKNLANDVKKFKHLTTGFVGTPILCSSLSKINRDDLAFMLLNRKEYPSWLYPVTQGATTIWERWDTQKPDGTIIDGMNSFNHYAYGAIGEWLYSHVGGVQLDEENPGYKRIVFSPHPGGGLTSSRTAFESLYGEIVSDWSIVDKTMTYHITIPPNTTGKVILPESEGKEIIVKNNKGKVINIDTQQDLGSGEYTFMYSLQKAKDL